MASINRQLVDDENQKEPTEIRTLGLSTVKLSINYKLWEPLSNNMQMDRIQHEVLHFIFLHPWVDKEDVPDLGLFYTACDLSVNMYSADTNSLRLEYFEKLCSRYSHSINTDEGYFSIYNSLVDLFRKIPSEIVKRHKTDIEAAKAEMDMHAKNAVEGKFFDEGTKDLNEAIVFLPKTGSGTPNVSGMQSMINSMGLGGASDEEIKNAIKNFIDSNPDPWKSVAQGTSASAAESVVKNLMRNSKSNGLVPGGLEGYVDLLLSPPKIDWRKECRNFTKTAGHVTSSSTMSRRSKKWKTFPSFKLKRQQKIAIAIDTSGSMSDEEFQQGISEVRGALSPECQVIVIQADCVVDNVEVYDRKLPKLDRITRYGNGGTSFDDVLLYVKTGGRLDKHHEFPDIGQVDGLVYITDGYAPAPQPENYPKCKLLWLTTQKSVKDLEQEGFRGKILELDCSD
jgi:predicted metal-dependent peptidase